MVDLGCRENSWDRHSNPQIAMAWQKFYTTFNLFYQNVDYLDTRDVDCIQFFFFHFFGMWYRVGWKSGKRLADKKLSNVQIHCLIDIYMEISMMNAFMYRYNKHPSIYEKASAIIQLASHFFFIDAFILNRWFLVIFV